jgi:hypothetical protein
MEGACRIMHPFTSGKNREGAKSIRESPVQAYLGTNLPEGNLMKPRKTI